MKRFALFGFLLGGVFVLSGAWLLADTLDVRTNSSFTDRGESQQATYETMPVTTPTQAIEQADSESNETPPLVSTHYTDVPFVAQAPYGEWDDPRQQDACEEASVLMAVHWARDISLSRRVAKEQILAMAEFQEEKYGNYHDTSAEDTLSRLLDEYLHFSNAEIQHNVGVEEIARALQKGVVVAPMDGQKLGNPHFTPPGPERHMLVIIGYDAGRKEFITNDPGTRHGKGYRYSAEVIEQALLNYPTGYHEPVINPTTAIILVSR